MKVYRSFKYKLSPNKEQQIMLNKTFGGVRLYWNNLVENFNNFYLDKDVRYYSQKEFKEINPFLKEISAVALHEKYVDFYKFRNTFFSKKGIGKPRFKTKKQKQSFRITKKNFSIKDNSIRLPLIGFVKFVKTRELPSNVEITSVTILKDKVGDCFISINFNDEKIVKNKSHLPNVGIDLGLKELASLSDGTVFGNPKYFSESQAKVRISQKHLDRKTKGSNRQRKQLIKLASIHRQIRNKREWYLHNVSRFVVDNYNEIGMENLKVKNMVNLNNMAKSVYDTSMITLRNFISYKQEDYGKKVLLLDTYEPSTKVCSVCGNIQSIKLSERVFTCTACNNSIDRDINAAIVIKNKTVETNAVQQTWRESKPDIHSNIDVRILNEALTV